MEELRYAALEYYKTSSSEEKQIVEGVFKRLDANKDGKVSYEEFAADSVSRGIGKPSCEKLADIDEDGDGYLDFQDAIVYYYLNRFRHYCDVCGEFIMGLYYSCVECFEQRDCKGRPLYYDVCLTCHRAGEFVHQHSSFLDSHVLLEKRTKEALQNKISKSDEASKLVGAVIEGAASGVAEGITNQVVSNCCSIM